MDIYLAIIGFLGIAILWAFIMFGVLNVGYKLKRKSIIYIFFIFIGIGVLLLIMGAVVEWIDSPEFCGTACHPRYGIVVDEEPMSPYYQSYKNPENNTIMAVHVENEYSCGHCHDKPGPVGKLEAYLKSVPEMINYVFENYDPDDLGGHVPNENCLKCHDDGIANEPGKVFTFTNTTVDPHKDEDKNCASCHDPHTDGIGLTSEACTVCHDVDQTELQNHGLTTQQDCMNCHYMEHPAYAAIPFDSVQDLVNNTFCADCHQPVFNEYEKWSTVQQELYGNCSTSCHTDHKESYAPHIATEPYESNCDSCHVDGVASHSLKNITLSTFPGDIGLDLCQNCHAPEYNAYSAWTPGEKALYGECSATCHSEHKQSEIPHIISSPYGSYCDSCHPDGTNTHNLANITYATFPEEIKTEFCIDCHNPQYKALQNGNHGSRECIDCHGEHKKVINVDFDSCIACHPDIPSSHDENRTDCGDCHDTDAIHRYG